MSGFLIVQWLWLSAAEGDLAEGTEPFQNMQLQENESAKLPAFKSIIINRLILKRGSKIEFPVQASGGDGASGLIGTKGGDGGPSILWIRELEGDLVVEARGGDGGLGRVGRDGKQGHDGIAGRRGHRLLWGAIYVGKGEDGGPGFPGEPGEDGGAGGDGGQGGRVIVIYAKKSSDSSVVVDVSGGAGGAGGRGGLGGLGGNGGRGGDKGFGGGRQGPMGPQGMSGRSGAPGRPGRPGVAAVYQISEELFDCLADVDAYYELAEIPFEERQREDYEQCRELSDEGALEDVEPEVSSNTDEIFHFASNGRDGVSSPVVWSMPPFDASSATSGGSVTLFFEDLPRHAVIEARGGNGGHGAQGMKGRNGRDGVNGRNGGLFRKSKPGGDAGNGENGGNGSNGGAAGHGGHLRIVVKAKSDLDPNWRSRFEVDLRGGKGGRGGDGGFGGFAGIGGQGGKYFLRSKERDDGRDGVDGLAGLAGLAGPDGEDGRIEFLEMESVFDWLVTEVTGLVESK